MPNLPKQLRIVLCHTSHPGNIGAAARAMKNMGLKNLVLVQPADFPSDHANARASGADDILQQATVVATLSEAIADCTWVLGTSARLRNLPQKLVTPREIAPQIIATTKNKQQVAIVFGHERNGLSNEELALCQHHIHIPCNADFSSLNLAAAVQIITYECLLASNEIPTKPYQNDTNYDTLASNKEMEGFYQHLNQTLTQIEFLDPLFPKRIIPKIRRLFNRANVETTELNILRGILTAINRKFDHNKD
jgi:tRNA (cytidine32/uridine32-2'-O)-methyltransferase